MSRTIYAIGDIHGHLDKLKEAHELIRADRAAHKVADAPVIHIGDLVDRGPDSRGVIDYLISCLEASPDWVVLRGNHDNLFRLFLAEGVVRDDRLRPQFTWLHPRLGGLDTLESYGIDADPDRPLPAMVADARAAVPGRHMQFLSRMPYFWTASGLFFAHAGIRPGIALYAQDPRDLMWVRDEFHESRADHGALIVHGHTPIEAAMHYGNRINIDSGAGMGRNLTTLVLEGLNAYVLTGAGRVPLVPV